MRYSLYFYLIFLFYSCGILALSAQNNANSQPKLSDNELVNKVLNETLKYFGIFSNHSSLMDRVTEKIWTLFMKEYQIKKGLKKNEDLCQ